MVSWFNNLIVNMDLGIFSARYELRMTTGYKKVHSGTQVLRSFFSVNGFGRIFEKKVLFENNRLIVFSIVCNSVNFKNNLKNNRSIVLKQYLIVKIMLKTSSSKGKILEPGPGPILHLFAPSGHSLLLSD